MSSGGVGLLELDLDVIDLLVYGGCSVVSHVNYLERAEYAYLRGERALSFGAEKFVLAFFV